jgi:phage FluMu gp28-like protein
VTLGIVKKTEDEYASWLGTEWGFIEGLLSYEDEPIVLEHYQRAFLASRARFRWITKSRQVGYSFLLALEALARSHLQESHNAVFISYNLDEAKERVAQAKQLHESLPLAYQKRIVVDAKTELAFESNGATKRLSRIVSSPSKAPRGKKGTVYIDELAHLVNDREVYRGSTALILRSNGQLTGCSTPLGRRGIFWEIACEELRKYPHHWRQIVPWWLCRFFCTDVRAASELALELPTEERVERFGRPSLIEQFDSLPLDDFQQEFENSFVDESYSFFPYELILPCTSDDLVVYDEPTSVRKPEGRIVAGFDVGRTRDRSELAVFEEREGRFTCRMLRSFEAAPFAEQEAELRRLFEVLPVARLSIDRSGIGMNLAENLTRDYPQVVGENFTNEAKERWATDFKILLQRGDVTMPRDRELVSQIHAIKRRVLPSGKVSFDAERNAKGHADKFWAVTLACQKEREAARPRTGEIAVRVLG